RYQTIPGVTSVTMAFRDRGTLGANYTGNTFRMLAVEADDFHYYSWYRDDFSRSTLPEVMRALNPLSVSEPVTLPDDAVAVGVWLKPEELYPNMYMWLVLQDADGVLDTQSLGNMGPPNWHLRTLEVPERMKRPVQLASIQIFEPVFGPAGTAGSILIDDVHAINGDGRIEYLEDFEDTASSWLPLATSTLSSDVLTFSDDDVNRGDLSGLFTFGKDTDNGLRGIYRSPSGGPVPVVASNSFLRTSGARVGDALIVELKGRFVPIQVRDSVDFFPTLNPSGAGFLIADLETLIRHINILSPALVATPNEMFIEKASGAGDSVNSVVTRMVGRDLVHDREQQLEQVRLDPLITAGWQAMVLLAMAIIIFTAGLGYITYLLAFSNRSRNEMGFLQSVGLSSRQMAGLLMLEHFIIVAVGIGLGSGAGWLMSDLMVSSVAVTENGRQVVPPFILETDFRFLAPLYLVLISIFALAVYRLTRSMRNLDFHAISRMD
ncbi:MAG: ABC transporter permease, partial [Chloroflexi bacterium]|nr:ABC transporter permease [Chloroflexota bacterium]